MGVEMIEDNPTTLPSSLLLELAAFDDVDAFKLAVEKPGFGLDDAGFWYTRNFGSNKMSCELRTPLMIAAQYGSIRVLDFIIGSGEVDVNRVAGSDRVTALHCAVLGGSDSCSSVVLRLVSAEANVNLLDASGNRACDLIAKLPKIPTKSKQLDTLLKGEDCDSISMSDSESDSSSKKEYSVSDLPDINNGVYGSDDFRMYCFKIKPCSRAYTHDWTECPFAHPGENARRRDPTKVNYTCVPCPEFKKGSCKKGEECEFAHGVFESWLHPAQYRTRLCKDETGCARKVCFFAHRREELRPVYASTGSAVPDNGMSVSSPRGNGGFGCTSTPPMSPSFAPSSPKNGASGGGGVMWQGKSSGFGGGTPPPSLQLPGSRLRSSLSARDMEFERELLKVEHQMKQQHFHNQQQLHHHQQQQQMMSPRWNNNGRISDMSPSNLETAFNSVNISRSMSMSTPMSMSMSPQSVLDSPMNIPRKMSPPSVLDSPKAVAMLNSRAAAFVKRSQSFIDRSATMNGNNSSPMSPNLSDWSAPNGKLDWGMQGEEFNKLRKSNSFGYKVNHNNTTTMKALPPGFGEPDVTWVNSLVKDETDSGYAGLRSPNYGRGGGGQGNGGRVQDVCPPWEQLYMEHEVVV
uniref:CCCH-type zinc finger protein n=1 Tax=Dianthus caryophyllus TaxID=3570 RepID=D4QD67_DIACA|nr:CCCH-type zinc finger protein [Dianthus caryophyllus]